MPNFEFEFAIDRTLDALDDAVIITDQDGMIQYVNKRFCKLLKYDYNQLIGKQFEDLAQYHDMDIFQVLKKYGDSNLRMNAVHILDSKNGELIFDLWLKPIEKKDDERRYYLIVMEDQTEYLEYENQKWYRVKVIETLTKSRLVREGKFEEAVYEIISQCGKVLGAERVNAWLVEDNFEKIKCIGNYDIEVDEITQNNDVLFRRDMPNYFSLLQKEEIICSFDSQQDHRTVELVDGYLKKYKIKSMMDIPIHLEGRMAGVICFEETGEKRIWNSGERKFGLIISQLISICIETMEKNRHKRSLEKLLREKEVLLSELHHRVKNNMSLVASLINLQSSKAKDEFHRNLFEECKNQVISVASVHSILYNSDSLEKLDLKSYFLQIIKLNVESFSKDVKNINVISDLDELYLNIGKSVPCGLMLNEILINAFKHGLKYAVKPELTVELKKMNASRAAVTIKDNGPGFKQDFEKNNSLGMSLIRDLSEQIDSELTVSNENGAKFYLEFDLS
jgi:PAS domain S-box-containing protein